MISRWILVTALLYVVCHGEEKGKDKADMAVKKSRKSFSHKLLYSDVPDIGQKWHGGVRSATVFIWDFNWNVADWFQIDLLTVGISDLEVDDDARITDKFSLITLKSPAWHTMTKYGPYKVAGGIKLFSEEFKVKDANGDEAFGSKDGSAGLFITQGLTRGRHYINLLTTLSGEERTLSGNNKSTSWTYFWVPGYSFELDKHWQFTLENFMTNTETIPIKILQYAADADNIEFYNPDQEVFSMMIWGFSYIRTSFRLDLGFVNHYTFKGLVWPIVGLGWYF